MWLLNVQDRSDYLDMLVVSHHSITSFLTFKHGQDRLSKTISAYSRQRFFLWSLACTGGCMQVERQAGPARIPKEPKENGLHIIPAARLFQRSAFRPVQQSFEQQHPAELASCPSALWKGKQSIATPPIDHEWRSLLSVLYRLSSSSSTSVKLVDLLNGRYNCLLCRCALSWSLRNH